MLVKYKPLQKMKAIRNQARNEQRSKRCVPKWTFLNVLTDNHQRRRSTGLAKKRKSQNFCNNQQYFKVLTLILYWLYEVVLLKYIYIVASIFLFILGEQDKG